MEESEKEEWPTAAWGQMIGQRKTTQKKEKKKVKVNKNPSGRERRDIHTESPGGFNQPHQQKISERAALSFPAPLNYPLNRERHGA